MQMGRVLPPFHRFRRLTFGILVSCSRQSESILLPISTIGSCRDVLRMPMPVRTMAGVKVLVTMMFFGVLSMFYRPDSFLESLFYLKPARQQLH